MQELDDRGRPIFTVNKIRHKSDRRDVIEELNISKPEVKLKTFWELSNPNSYKPENKTSNVKNNYPDKEELFEPEKKDGIPSSNNQRPDKYADSEKEDVEKSDNGEKPTPPENGNASIKHNPNRNNLIPSNIKYVIDNKKCKKIYDELKGKLRHDECPMSISVLFRVFVELSLICYLDKNKIILKKQQQGLHDKVVAVSNDLKEKRLLTNSQVSSVQSVSSSITSSQGSLQQYMHNKDTLPDKSSLNIHFDNLHCLFSAIWK
jgi:hypothetical protein